MKRGLSVPYDPMRITRLEGNEWLGGGGLRHLFQRDGRL